MILSEYVCRLKMEEFMSISDQIYARLSQAMPSSLIEVVDDSAAHAGHAGNPGGEGETHFKLRIRSSAFEGKSRLARHRMVHAALGDIVPRIHALELDLDIV